MQQHLEAKRGALEKNLEQLVGQINRVNGAIAVVDELIAESKAREEADLLGDPVEYCGGIDRTPSEYWKIREYPDAPGSIQNNALLDHLRKSAASEPLIPLDVAALAAPLAPAPPAPKEMLPVSRDEFGEFEHVEHAPGAA